MNRLILASLIGFVSCTFDSDTTSEKDVLLTSTNWTVPLKGMEEKNLEGIWSFGKDGTYIENFAAEQNIHRIVVAGTWKWISENEISIIHKTMLLDGVTYDLGTDEGDSFVLRITELSKENLRLIRRHNGDAEDSGFAKHLSYVAIPK